MMDDAGAVPEDADSERDDPGAIRLILEEICADLCRFIHVADDGLAAAEVQVRREVSLGHPGAFADIHVRPGARAPYTVEIKIGYPDDRLVRQLARKYGPTHAGNVAASRMILVIRPGDYSDWAAIEAELRDSLAPGLALEIWDEARLLELLRRHFGVEVASLAGADITRVHDAIERAKWRLAYGQEADEVDGSLRSSLLWHFSPWALGQARSDHRLGAREVLRPGLYRDLAIVIADMCSFSSYVRDTRDDALIRHCLAMFYSQARHAIHNCGGMLYQFVGDEVVGVFGYPFGLGGGVERVLACARALLDIGTSVAYHWQREIDRVQKSAGVHVGMALGDLNLVPLRPCSRSHIGFVGDGLNIAARLMNAATCGQIVASNTLYNRLSSRDRAGFSALDGLEAKNVGMISCWRYTSPGPALHPAAVDPAAAPPEGGGGA